MKYLTLILSILILMFMSLNMAYSRTSTTVICAAEPCPNKSDFQKKIITEFDEHSLMLRQTTIWCDGTVSVQEFDEHGKPLSVGTNIGNIPNSGETYYNFNYIQVGPAVTSWTLTGFNESHELLYNIQMNNNAVQIVYPVPPPVLQSVNSSQDTKLEDVDARMLVIYPIPAKDKILLKIDNKICKLDVTNCNIAIGSLEGKIVYSKKNINLSNGQEYIIDVSNLPAGDYGISVSNVGMKFSVGKSFIKE